MLDPATTVRRAAKLVGVHENTSFRWRHRLLAWVRHDRQLPLRGIVEADEMFFLESEKGARRLTRAPRKRGGVAGKRGISGQQVCVLVARDRGGRTHDAVTGKGPLSKAQLQHHLDPVLDDDVLLVTDGHAAYSHYARSAGIAHEFVNLRAGERVRGIVHVERQRLSQSPARLAAPFSRRRHALPGQLLWLALSARPESDQQCGGNAAQRNRGHQ
jgi:hypothetical protein